MTGQAVGDVWFIHLRVVSGKTQRVERARVLLERMEIRQSDGSFAEHAIPAPMDFVWTPSELNELLPDFVGEKVFDFVTLQQRAEEVSLRPCVRVRYASVDPRLNHDATVRYHIRVEAANARNTARAFVDVKWDGVWTDDPARLASRLSVSAPKHGTSDNTP